MKKKKQLFINYTPDERDAIRLSKKVNELLEESVPNSILGMLATAEEKSDSLIFYKRFKLRAHERHDYEIVDLITKKILYKNIALFASALGIVYHTSKPLTASAPKDKLIYDLDQEYYRRIENVKFYLKKLKTSNKELKELYGIKLSQNRQRLSEIKTLISKIY